MDPEETSRSGSRLGLVIDAYGTIIRLTDDPVALRELREQVENDDRLRPVDRAFLASLAGARSPRPPAPRP